MFFVASLWDWEDSECRPEELGSGVEGQAPLAKTRRVKLPELRQLSSHSKEAERERSERERGGGRGKEREIGPLLLRIDALDIVIIIINYQQPKPSAAVVMNQNSLFHQFQSLGLHRYKAAKCKRKSAEY